GRLDLGLERLLATGHLVDLATQIVDALAVVGDVALEPRDRDLLLRAGDAPGSHSRDRTRDHRQHHEGRDEDAGTATRHATLPFRARFPSGRLAQVIPSRFRPVLPFWRQ